MVDGREIGIGVEGGERRVSFLEVQTYKKSGALKIKSIVD